MAMSNRRAEENSVRQDLAAQELGVDGPSTPSVAPAFLRAVSPEGHLVTFVPGETLPAWVRDVLAAGPHAYDADTGAWLLGDQAV